MGQLKNEWTGPEEGTDVPNPSGMNKNTWTGPVVGTGATNERDGSAMIAQDVSTTYKTDSEGNPTLMTRGEEQLQEALAKGGSFDKQMAGMDNVTTVGGWATAMAKDDWPVEGKQVPLSTAMDVWDGVEDEFTSQTADGIKQTWAEGYLKQTGAMKTAEDMNETKIRKDEIHHDALHKGAMSRQPEDAIGGGAKLSDGPMKDFQAPHLSQERMQGLLGNIPGFDKPSPRFGQPASGEVDLYRRAVEIANGFQMPIQYSMKFKCPQGINQPSIIKQSNLEETRYDVGFYREVNRRNFTTTRWLEDSSANPGYVEQGGLDWQSHLMNSSVNGGYSEGHISNLYMNAAQVSQTLWDPQRGNGEKVEKQESILNLFCSKVSMPEKSINFQSMRHYGTHFAYPQSVSYGTMSTSFYCDASMHIKKFFDAWQKLIFNDITGNFNYYQEFTSEFDIFTRSVVGVSENADEQDKNWFEKGQDAFRAAMDTVNKYSGLQGRSGGPHRTYADYKYPKMEFRNTYGVKVMECWPQIVGSVDLGHASTNSIAEFTVTWAYKKWNTFNLGEIGKRGQVNLSNSVLHEKGDGIPFVQDMPQELRGPLTQHADQSLMSMPQQRGFSITG